MSLGGDITSLSVHLDARSSPDRWKQHRLRANRKRSDWSPGATVQTAADG